MKMDHAALAVRDVDRSIKFYSKALGMKLLRLSVVQPTPDLEIKNAYMYSDTFLLELVTAEASATQKERPKTWQEGMRKSIGITHLGVRVQNLNEAIKRARAAGAQILGSPMEIRRETSKILYAKDKVTPKISYAKYPGKKPWRIVTFLDPDGIMVELIER